MTDNVIKLDALHAELRSCRRCLEEGYWIAPGPVFSGGPGARVMLIGQAPGVTEGQTKRPFNAGSGRRLFQWLGEAGWDEDEFRANAYMSAITKCYPGPSGNGKGDRVATPFEQALCRPWLEQELRLINPRLIILVGGLAMKLFYPPNMRLNEIIGTGAYFPPEALAADPLNFDLGQAEIIATTDDGPQTTGEVTNDELRMTNEEALLTRHSSLVTRHSPGGRFVIPLPHPSGASLWPNKPENQALIRRAIALLRKIRVAYDL
jgi:uracil-DNA glycosylase